MLLSSLIILVTLLVLGMPVVFVFTACTLFFLFLGGYQVDFLVPYGFSKVGTSTLLAIPLFIMAGGLMARGDIGGKLVNMVELFVGRIRGGLGVVATVSCAVFGSVTGSAAATLSCIGSIMFPLMNEARYPRGHTAALLANTAVIGMLIPPSNLMILFCWVGGQSVLACFLAGIIPGILLTIGLSLVNCFLLRNNASIVMETPIPQGQRRVEFSRRTKVAIPALFMPFIILGGIYGGIMTPTEAAAIAVIYALPVGFWIYRKLTWQDFKESFVESATTAGLILVMSFAIMILSRIYIMEDVPQQIITFLYGISQDKYVILFMLNIFMIIIGMLMDDVSGVLLCTPILLPIVRKVGVDPVHFAAILTVNLGMGNVTPPAAPLLYLAGSLNTAKISEMLLPTLYMLLFAWLPVLIITTYIPDVALFLPRIILGM